MNDLNLLRALAALLDEQNVTRAAERTFVTQQAMSGSLRRLREHFGDELLVRIGRRFEPTPLAIALRAPLREAMLRLDHLVDVKAIFDPLLSTRRFRIAMSDYAGLVLLPRLMPILAARAPGMVIDVTPIDTNISRDIEHGHLDFCLFPNDWRLFQGSVPKDLLAMTLFSDDFVCAVDRNRPDISTQLTAQDYASSLHCSASFGHGARSLIEQAWSEAGIEPHVAATATTFANLLFMVPGTRLIATAQRKLVRTFEPLLSIRMIECPVPIARLNETLSWHQRNHIDPAHRFMRWVLADAAKAMLNAD